MNQYRYNIHALAFPLAIALLVLPCVQPVCAQDNDITALRKQVEDLQGMVKALQKQIDNMQGRTATETSASTQPKAPATVEPVVQEADPSTREPAAPAKPPTKTQAPGPETIRENWHALNKGMSRQAVNQLLGAPNRTFKLNDNLIWYYEYGGIGRGSVMFSRNGQVIDWQAPPTLRWFW